VPALRHDLCRRAPAARAGAVLLLDLQVQPRCYGPLRTLYVREIVGGAARGWRAVGTVCLRCHAVKLDEERLP
jgi:hypothetical protein